MRILAVDDDPIILDLLKGALPGAHGYDLVCCASAEEALDTLADETNRFECFLLDIMLPGIDGIELCENLRGLDTYRTTPIIMITASKEPGLMGRAFHAGATDFVTKPLDGMELGARINTAGMLNNSLLREREAQHSLAEMTAKLKLQFEESIELETEGVTDLITMENDLLRMHEGLYAMTLFAVDVLGMESTYRNTTARAFRRQLEQVATALRGELAGAPWKLAYVGGGRFAAVSMSRKRPNFEVMRAQMQATLALEWNASDSEEMDVPELQITPLSDQRLWSGRSASDFLRGALEEAKIPAVIVEEVVAEVVEVNAAEQPNNVTELVQTEEDMSLEDLVNTYAIAAE